jgi:hypothetical protein
VAVWPSGGETPPTASSTVAAVCSTGSATRSSSVSKLVRENQQRLHQEPHDEADRHSSLNSILVPARDRGAGEPGRTQHQDDL